MRIQCLNDVVLKDKKQDAYGEGPSVISDGDYGNLKQLGMTHVWYWYESYGYEGSGQLLAKHPKGYYLVSLDHCSCNDPMYDFERELERGTEKAYPTLADVAAACSAGYLDEVTPLLEAAAKQIGLLTLKRPETETEG